MSSVNIHRSCSSDSREVDRQQISPEPFVMHLTPRLEPSSPPHDECCALALLIYAPNIFAIGVTCCTTTQLPRCVPARAGGARRGLSPWGRSMADLLTTLQELRDLDVGFVSLTEALDLTTPSGRAMAGLLACLRSLNGKYCVNASALAWLPE